MNEFRWMCDCPTKDAMVCRDNPDCRPSYCKMSFYEIGRVTHQHQIDDAAVNRVFGLPNTESGRLSPNNPDIPSSEQGAAK